MAAKNCRGFTLIESIIAIILMGLAMTSLITFLFPQVQDSARPHYEVRAAALANSFLTVILARGYDENSDIDGGIERCGEGTRVCSTTFGPDGIDEIENSVRKPQNFNDVDDYIGCWTTNSASEAYCNNRVGNLNDIFGNSISDEYANFAANVEVTSDSIDGNSEFKKVTVTVTAGQFGDYRFSAHRGNF